VHTSRHKQVWASLCLDVWIWLENWQLTVEFSSGRCLEWETMAELITRRSARAVGSRCGGVNYARSTGYLCTTSAYVVPFDRSFRIVKKARHYPITGRSRIANRNCGRLRGIGCPAKFNPASISPPLLALHAWCTWDIQFCTMPRLLHDTRNVTSARGISSEFLPRY